MTGPTLRLLDRKAAIGFATALLILLGINGVAYRQHLALGTAAERVDHTHRVIDALHLASRRLSDAESAERGYLLTGDSAFFATFRAASRDALPALTELRTLTREHPAQNRRADTLATLAAGRIAEMDATIRTQGRLGVAAARAMTTRQRIDSTMTVLDGVGQRFEATERERLAARALEREEERRRLGIVMLLGSAAALLIALLATVRVVRAQAARMTLERERDAQAAELAMQSGELSAQNEELIAQGEALQVAMDQVEGANAAKSAFLAQMSHELRTPLNSVIGFANIVRRNPRGTLTDSELAYLDRVVENGRHLLRTINSILDLSKIEAKQEHVELELVSLPELAREVLASLETQAATGQLTMAVEAPATLASIVTDRDKLRRVLVNLVANAVKFTKAGGTVTVRVVVGDRMPTTPLAIEVRDSGVGIAPNRLAAIFDAFEQGDVGVGREYGGTGLGLSISRALCRLLHYDLTVASTLGEGSTFRVTLARQPGAAEPHEPTPR